MNTALKHIAIALILLPLCSNAQQNVPTKGTDFWVGFMQNFLNGMPGETLELFVTSDVSTSGTVTIPGQSWSASFEVDAHATTSIELPVDLAECRVDNAVEARGVHVVTADTVSVFAMNLEPYTADGTKVLPVQSLGTRYRVSAYKAAGPSGSELLVVATEDATHLLITPSVQTLAGHQAGVPFEVTLDQGDTYLLQAQDPGDLTGTLVEGAPDSGGCRPFAVFSGATCASVPETCAACDHIFEQNFPVTTWGTSYQAVPFFGPETFSLRVIADQAANVTVNGVPHAVPAGGYLEWNELTSPQCVESSVPVQAVQFMEGVECGAVGDPAMLVLNSEDQEIDAITFSTVDSEVIATHALTLVTDASNAGSIRLDGAEIPAGNFETFPNCPGRKFVRLSINTGSHSLESEGMFTAYVYGNGFAESYAYSAGSYARVEPETLETQCFSSDLELQAPDELTNTSWFLLPDSTTSIASGETLHLTPPFASGVYQVQGEWGISGCPGSESFAIEYSQAPTVSVAPEMPSICIHDHVAATVSVTSDVEDLNVWWEAEYGLADTLSLNPEFSPQTSTVYTLHLATPGGCVDEQLSYVVEVIEEDPTFDLGADLSACEGDSVWVEVPMPGVWDYAWNNTAISGNAGWMSEPGNYTLTVTSPGGCAHTDSVAFSQSPAPHPGWNPIPAFCAGDSLLLSLPDGTWSVAWTDGHLGDRFVHTEELLHYEVTDQGGCTYTGAVSPEIWAAPDLYVPDEVYTCDGDPATIEAFVENAALTWQDGSTEASVIVQAPGYFSVTATNGLGCTTTDSTLVEVLERPELDLGPDVILCDGESVWLQAPDGDWNYLWSDGSTNPFLQVTEPGAYEVTVGNGMCDAVDQVFVEVVPAPENPFPSDTTWCFEDGPILLRALNPGHLFVWNNGSTAEETTYDHPGTASLTVTSPLGCETTFNLEMEPFCTESMLYFPNAFTPDGDGVNDTFGAQGSGIGRFHLRIWNRWGDEVWSTSSMEESWNGTGDRRGKHGESEVYVYMVTYTTILDDQGTESFPQELRGFVTLVR